MERLSDREIVKMIRNGVNIERELGKRAGKEACEFGLAETVMTNSGIVELFGADWVEGFSEAVRAWEIVNGEL